MLDWTYSRNQRRHTAYDRFGEEAFHIVSLAPYNFVQGKYGYALRLPYGTENLAEGKSVAKLKLKAEAMSQGVEGEK